MSEVQLQLLPREEGLQAKDVPGEALGKKLVSVRDKLRVLEQRVNASGVTLEDKIALQARITRLYDAICGLHAFFSDDTLPKVDDTGDAEGEG